MARNKLILGDCLDKMKAIEDSSIDLIITSPPYEDISGAGYTSKNKDVLFLKLYLEFLDKVFQEYHRILKDTGQIYFNIKSKTLKKALKTPHWIEFTEGFQKFIFKSYIIWKYAGSFDSTKSRYHLDYEIIYHLSKTDNINLNLDIDLHDPLSSVWYVPHNIKAAERIHPTQMPIGLVDRILKVAAKDDYVILDNFLGSGTTGVACKNKDLDFIGIEINPENFKKAEARINGSE